MGERGEWPVRKLRELVAFAGGYGFSDRFQGESIGDLPFFKVSDMNTPGNERTLHRANHYVMRDLAARQSWRPMPASAVVFAKVGAALLLNRRRLLERDSLIDNNMLAAVAGEGVHWVWLYWWLQRVDFGMFVQPGAVPSVNQGQLGALTVDLPPLPEQRRIAEILDTLDEAIRKTEQIIAKLKQVKQGLLHDLLTRGIDDNGELRDPIRHPEQFKDSQLGTIPNEWHVSLLHEVAEVRSGIAKNEARAIQDPVEVQYLRVANVQDGYLELGEMKTIRVPRADVERYRVLPGDVLMNEGGDLDKLGRGSLWRGEHDPCVHQNHVFVVRCGQRLRPEFLNVWTGAHRAKSYFMVAGKQTTNLASINKTQLGRLPVPVPPAEEQNRIIAVLNSFEKRLNLEDAELAKMRTLKQGLMEDLLTGQVRVFSLIDEAVRTAQPAKQLGFAL